MNIVDLNDKFVMRDTLDGQERSVAFMEYREHAEDKRVITGVSEVLPHLDPFITLAQLLDRVREKYPRGEWSLETEPAWCKRPEYLAMIQRGIEEGFDYYDVIGEVTPEQEEPLTEDWQFIEEAKSVETAADHRTPDLWRVMAALDAEIDG